LSPIVYVRLLPAFILTSHNIDKRNHTNCTSDVKLQMRCQNKTRILIYRLRSNGNPISCGLRPSCLLLLALLYRVLQCQIQLPEKNLVVVELLFVAQLGQLHFSSADFRKRQPNSAAGGQAVLWNSRPESS